MSRILVSGGQLDPNIGVLLRRMLARKIDFADLLVGPGLIPRFEFGLGSGEIWLNGRHVLPTACFIRHDVFGQQAPKPVSPMSALGWYYALRGWALSNENIRCFNRHSLSGEGSKLQNLVAARLAGFEIPETHVTNEPANHLLRELDWIRKPIGGGEYTVDFDVSGAGTVLDHPAIFQHKMLRPEMRVYRIGDELFGFSINSADVDYRNSRNVDIGKANLDEIATRFMGFCKEIKLDFAAADFMRHPDTKELVFLEINTQPMFVAFDKIVGGKMCDAIIDTLSK